MGEMNKKKDLTVVIAIVCAAVLAAVVFGIAAHGISSRRETPDTSIGGSTQQPDPTVKTTDSASAPDASDSEPVTAPPTEKNTQVIGVFIILLSLSCPRSRCESDLRRSLHSDILPYLSRKASSSRFPG